MKNISFASNCGDSKRVIMRDGGLCIIGCFIGNKKETIEAINKKYRGQSAIDYINKVEELYSTDFTSFTDYKNKEVLNIAAISGYIDVIKYLHINGCDINYNSQALRRSSENGHIEIVKYLVQQGADINMFDGHALTWAVYYGHLEVVKYLIEQGADINIIEKDLLKCSLERGHVNINKYLKQNFYLKDRFSPLGWSTENNKIEYEK